MFVNFLYYLCFTAGRVFSFGCYRLPGTALLFSVCRYLLHCSATAVLFQLFFFSCYADHRDLHSFPTRRSSDLLEPSLCFEARPLHRRSDSGDAVLVDDEPEQARSEEHTSELQSPMYLVCRLLLEKKKEMAVACL